MIGGELLAKGSSSCVFKPNIPCTSSDNVNDNKITKIVYSKKSKARSIISRFWFVIYCHCGL